MTDLVIPPALRHARARFTYLDNTGLSLGAYNRVPQTTDMGGNRVGASIEFTPHGGRTADEQSALAQLRAFIFALRGKQNRVYLTDNSYVRRGAFPASELFANTDFNGTTGWIAGSKYALTASNGILRATVVDGSQANSYPAYQAGLTVSNYLPYVMRGLLRTGRGSFAALYPLSQNQASTVYGATLGYAIYSTANSSSGTFGFYDGSSSGNTAGDFVEILFASASRCLLVDGGGNLIADSDNFPGWTAAGASSSSNTQIAPDGTTTGDTLTENGSSSEHYLQKGATGLSSGVADYTFSVDINAATRSWFCLRLIENTGSGEASCFFNAATGVIGTPSAGSNWANVRAHIVSRGNSWYRCTITAQKTNAATSVTARVQSATGDGASLVFLGNSSVAGRLWRGVLQQSSAPTRGTQTTTVAVAAQSQEGGAGIYVKGGRSSAEGALANALVAGDWVEIDGQLMKCESSLDLDASGLGFFRVSPPPMRPLADNTPIIIHRPTGRFIFSGDAAGYDIDPGVFGRASLEFEGAPLS